MIKADIGIIGLGVMGSSLAIHLSRKGWQVAVCDEFRPDLLEQHCKNYPRCMAANSLEEFVCLLKKPAKILKMINAGKPVDDYLQKLCPYLETGDTVIDGGNSHFADSERRFKRLKEKDIYFVGMGISGGEYGALHGASFMPGGSRKGWKEISSIFETITAKTEEGHPCCCWIGTDGAGHFVKMVHNGIEYGLMQILCEVYHILKCALSLDHHDIHEVFQSWNRGPVRSYLLEISTDILSKKEGSTPILDLILDTAKHKGTGKWTAQAALDLGVAIPTISTAIHSRFLSAIRNERLFAATQFNLSFTDVQLQDITNNIYHALCSSMMCTYAQGFALIQRASLEYGWQLKLHEIARIWRGGCIIRAEMLSMIERAFFENNDLENVLIDPFFVNVLNKTHDHWRALVISALNVGVPIPAISSALNYFDSYRSAWLPANLLQAQRDYFGAHGYERKDQPGTFHSDWRKK